MSNADNSISFEIQERIGTIAVYPTGWSKELNLVSWNGGAPKYELCRERGEDREEVLCVCP